MSKIVHLTLDVKSENMPWNKLPVFLKCSQYQGGNVKNILINAESKTCYSSYVYIWKTIRKRSHLKPLIPLSHPATFPATESHMCFIWTTATKTHLEPLKFSKQLQQLAEQAPTNIWSHMTQTTWYLRLGTPPYNLLDHWSRFSYLIGRD